MKKAGISVDTGENLAERFFKALAAVRDDLAMEALRDEAFNDESAGTPTPRLRVFFESGEWDLKEPLGLVFADESTCAGRVGSFVAGKVERFCGKPNCSIPSQARAVVGGIKKGFWYIQAGTRSTSRCFAKPSLPGKELGSPVPIQVGNRFGALATTPFPRLRLGQWKFIFSSWNFDQDTITSPVKREVEGSSERPMTELLGLGDLVIEEKEDDASLMPSLAPSSLGSPPSSIELQGVDQDVLLKIKGLEGRVTQLKQKLSVFEAHVELLQHDIAESLARIGALEAELSERTTMTTTDKDLLMKLALAVLEPRGTVPRIEHELQVLSGKVDSGGTMDFHGFKFLGERDCVAWFVANNGKIALFADAVALLRSINATVVHANDSLKSQKAAWDVEQASELEASIIASFSTTLPSILVGNKKDLSGGAYECLISYLKDYSIWHPAGPQGSSGLKTRLRDGGKSVSARLKALREILTSNTDIREMAMLLASDSLSFIYELIEFVESQYRDLTDSTTFSETSAWSLIVDCMAHIFCKLNQARALVLDAGHHEPRLYLWGCLKVWQIQERNRNNQFKDDPALTGLLVRRLMIHDGEQTLKEQLSTVTVHESRIDDMQKKMAEHHKEFVALQKPVVKVEKQ